ncbi:MAG: T9SS type A sorting domain-containing protein, partial [Flavobacterium sp.]
LGNWQAASGTMQPAKGYIIRASSNFNMGPENINTQFVGVPRNGNISCNLERGNFTEDDYEGANGVDITKFDDNHNLIGNPYPSAISASAFINANAYDATNNPTGQLLGTVKLWQHGIAPSTSNANPFYGSYSTNYSANDYLTINSAGTLPYGGSEIIKSGQGFFVTMVDGTAGTGNVNFTNAMRLDSGNVLDNANFFRMATESTNTKSRIWLDLVNTQNNTCLAKTLIAYINDATNDYDNLYDAITKFNTSEGLFSKINNQIYEIQGRAPFVVSDQVPLAFKTNNSGSFALAINAVDGLFLNNQTIYVKDNLLNTVHNLSQSPYNFTAASGVNQDRFEIVYQNNLKTDNFSNNQVFIFIDNFIHIQANENIQQVEVYDILGKLVKNYSNINTKNWKDNFNFANGVYMVKVKTE